MTKSIKPSDISTRKLHQLLLSAVAPRPIALASTIDKNGIVNLSPFSYFNVFSTNPPIAIFSPANRGTDGFQKDTLLNVHEVKEVVINIVNYEMVEQMSLSSNSYDKGVNEFIKAGFTEVKSENIQPPRVGESPVALECKVNNVVALGDGPGAGNLVICEVIMMHINEAFLDENGALNTEKLNLVGRMGDNWYIKSTEEALFEIPKPIRTIAIGIDMLPQHIKNSKILSANNLGRLGNIDKLPTQDEIRSVQQMAEVQKIIKDESKPSREINEALEQLGKNWLELGRVKEALAVLMIG